MYQTAAKQKWNYRMARIATEVASWSKDPSTKVGAVICDAENVIISTGFNGPPRGASDSGLDDRSKKILRTIHAETNAILFARRDLTGCTMYVTHHPCAQCAALIAQSGIKNVKVIGDQQLSDKWADHISEAQQIFKESKIYLDILHVCDNINTHHKEIDMTESQWIATQSIKKPGFSRKDAIESLIATACFIMFCIVLGVMA